MKLIMPFFLLLFILSLGCTSSEVKPTSNWFHPSVESSWHWQLSGKINMKRDVDIYIVDLFDVSTSQVEKLHKSGKKVIAYFSAGSYESWRKDAKSFSKKVLGKKMDGWDERWLDIRSSQVAKTMINRIKLAKEKGFDGIEADNVDGFSNKTGFLLTAQNQLKYNIFLANESHKQGLAIALKNDVDQIQKLEPYFDFLIIEECHAYKECDKVLPFIKAGKPVFNAEYSKKNHIKICKKNKIKGLHILTLPLNLDDSFHLKCK